MIGQFIQIRCPHLDDTNTDTRITKAEPCTLQRNVS